MFQEHKSLQLTSLHFSGADTLIGVLLLVFFRIIFLRILIISLVNEDGRYAPLYECFPGKVSVKASQGRFIVHPSQTEEYIHQGIARNIKNCSFINILKYLWMQKVLEWS